MFESRAGSAVANRLSEIENATVLPLEAGGEETDVTDIPSMSGFTSQMEYNWGLNSIPQDTGCVVCFSEALKQVENTFVHTQKRRNLIMKGSWRYTGAALKFLQIYFQSFRKAVVIPVAHVAFQVCYLVIIAMQVLGSKSISEWVVNFHAFVSFLQLLLKFVVLWKKKQQYITLLIKNEKFWSTTASSESSRNQLDAILEYVLIFQRIFVRFASVVAIIIAAISLNQGNIPIAVWTTIQYQDFFYPAVFVGVSTFIFGVFTISIVDSLFLVFCVHLGVQFRILSDRFAHLDLSSELEYKRNLKNLVQHHDFLLRFQEGLQRFYSPVLTIQYLTIAPMICVNMYFFLEGESFDIMINSFCSLVGEIAQISLYCLPAEILINMASEVSFGAYNSDWPSSRSTTIRNDLTLVIQRSQQPMAFLGVGMFDIRARALLTIMRASYSVCAVIRAMKNK